LRNVSSLVPSAIVV